MLFTFFFASKEYKILPDVFVDSRKPPLVSKSTRETKYFDADKGIFSGCSTERKQTL
jgi:hypothetical protein